LSERYSVHKDRRHGTYTSFYGNGNIEERSFYIEGVLVGLVETFYLDNSPDTVCYYNENGNLQGEFKSYYANGNVKMTARHVDGKFEGNTVQFHYNGQIRVNCSYKNGLLEGANLLYDSTGILVERTMYKDGKRILEFPTKKGTCVLCGEDETDLRILPCKHEVCACIDDWLREKNKCPFDMIEFI